MTPAEPAEWEARTMLELGVLIARYVAENPCPGGDTDHPALYRGWARHLQSTGKARLENLEVGPLRAVSAD